MPFFTYADVVEGMSRAFSGSVHVCVYACVRVCMCVWQHSTTKKTLDVSSPNFNWQVDST